MATTRTRSTSASNGSAGANKVVAKAKEAGDSVSTAAGSAKGPLLAASAAAAGLAGGMALGSRMGSKRRSFLSPRRKILGVPVGRKSGVVVAAGALTKVARELSSATNRVSDAADDVHQVREQLDKSNRQSPVEVLLDGLTHRRGAHKKES
jgi:hypothetical protein